MTGSIEQSVTEAMWAFSPRPLFAGELLIALRRAAAGLQTASPTPGRDRWVVASSIAGVATAASAAALYGFKRMNRRGRAA